MSSPVLGIASAVLGAGGAAILYFVQPMPFYDAAFASAASVAHDQKAREWNKRAKWIRRLGFALVLAAAAVQITNWLVQ